MSRISLGVLACVIAGVIATPVSARVFASLFPPEPDSFQADQINTNFLPPAGYVGLNWTHPNGCSYARTGRSGNEVWLLTHRVDYIQCSSILAQAGVLSAY